jgi:hypothetical protein
MWAKTSKKIGFAGGLVVLLWGCSPISKEPTHEVGERDAGGREDGGAETPGVDCDNVTIDGDEVSVQEEDVTARFRMGALGTSTVMMFGGEPVKFENAVSNMGLVALDQSDAVVLAQKYDDFYLCSSPGGIEAQNYIVQFDLVPASCRVYDQLLRALADFARNSSVGGDRVSLSFKGAKLELQSVTFDNGGMDVTDQFADLNFHLVTEVEQITGESLIEFGNMP